VGEDAQTLVAQLRARPGDADLRRRAAEALDAAGGDPLPVLAGFVNLTGHDDDVGLPCLCKRCLPSAGKTAEASDMKFVRSFAVRDTRVLHFWMLADQPRAQVRASVAEQLEVRQAALDARRKERR
jgi:hypothetical protein